MTVVFRNPGNRFFQRFGRIMNYRFPPVAVYALIFYFSSRPASFFPRGIPDLIPHFLEFCVLSFLFLRMFEKPVSRQQTLISFFILLVLALLDEIHQLFVPDRVFSLLDLLYDLAGILAGMLAYVRLKNQPDSTQR